MAAASLDPLSQHQPTSSTPPLVTQMQPPMLPPPPHPNFQSGVLHTRLPVTSDLPLSNGQKSITQSHIEYQLPDVQTQFRVARFQHQVSDKLSTEPSSQSPNIQHVLLSIPITEPFIEMSKSETLAELPVSRPSVFSKLDSYFLTRAKIQTTTSNYIIVSSSLQVESHSSATQISQTKLPHQQPSSIPIQQVSQSNPQQSFTESRFPLFLQELTTIQHLPSTKPPSSSNAKPPDSQIYSHPSPTLPKPPSSIFTPTEIQPSSTPHPVPNSQPPPPERESFPLGPKIQPSISTNPTSNSSELDPEISVVPHVNISSQLNISQQGQTVQSDKSANDTEWLKRNTSQSPMTSNDPR